MINENNKTKNQNIAINHCSIILINWNGWKDTIECIETVLKQDYPNFDIIIVDNGSEDNSIEEIRNYLFGTNLEIETNYPNLVYPLYKKPLDVVEIGLSNINNFENRKISQKIPKIFMIKSEKNLGFAKANNIAAKFAIQNLKTSYLFILNNDTIIDKNTITSLINFSNKYPLYAVLQSLIYYYDDSSKIWQAGGKILPWAQVKYYYKITKENSDSISFISGCAMFIKSEIVKKYGTFSEKFFHGEEDFEFSLRMLKNKEKMALVTDSIVYHKIAASVEKKWDNNPAKLINFALNRLINMRDYYNKMTWFVWRLFALVYFYILLIRYYDLPISKSLFLIREVFRWSSKLNSVKNEDVELIMDNSDINP